MPLSGTLGDMKLAAKVEAQLYAGPRHGHDQRHRLEAVGLCTLLREDGVTYHQYVTELTYLLFLKMMKRAKREAALARGKFRWDEPDAAASATRQLQFYRRRCSGSERRPQGWSEASTENAQTSLKKPKTLATLVKAFDERRLVTAPTREGLGDLYEGLLEKERQRGEVGAGQYFTPRRWSKRWWP